MLEFTCEDFEECSIVDELHRRLDALYFQSTLDEIVVFLTQEQAKAVINALFVRRKQIIDFFMQKQPCSVVLGAFYFCPYCNEPMFRHKTIVDHQKKPKGFKQVIKCPDGYIWRIETCRERPIYIERTNGYKKRLKRPYRPKNRK